MNAHTGNPSEHTPQCICIVQNGTVVLVTSGVNKSPEMTAYILERALAELSKYGTDDEIRAFSY